jgi:hypothetical protein
MNDIELNKKSAALVLALATFGITAYMWLFLHAESQLAVGVLIVVALGLTLLGKKLGTVRRIEEAAASRPGLARIWSLLAALALVAAFYDSHFVLLMIGGVLLYATA